MWLTNTKKIKINQLFHNIQIECRTAQTVIHRPWCNSYHRNSKSQFYRPVSFLIRELVASDRAIEHYYWFTVKQSAIDTIQYSQPLTLFLLIFTSLFVQVDPSHPLVIFFCEAVVLLNTFKSFQIEFRVYKVHVHAWIYAKGGQRIWDTPSPRPLEFKVNQKHKLRLQKNWLLIHP